MKASPLLAALTIFLATELVAQSNPSTTRNPFGTYVDTAGVLRWHRTNGEVSLFGANYTSPFAYAYRAQKKLGVSLKKSIDLDVAQMARLGFDGFRVHVWDREISDSDGNLLSNEHLDLFDYLLARLAEHRITIILTPIAWWGNGWPEPDQPTQGFSQHYTKPELITSQGARRAERNYLRQFIDHINPYRKLSYKDDSTIIAIEIINEPHHPADGPAVTDYINEMAGVLRGTGLSKPLFYNISENWNTLQANAVSRANIDGVSFQWYPTDLVHGRLLKGNYLLNVNSYPIPTNTDEILQRRAKIVYEFDAADVGGSYMYPAIARSFREAGMQFAAMFSYDPSQLAWSNTEYPTHYMNLLYTPSKAISALIAAKVFKKIPRLKSFGSYPGNSRFDDFRVSYEEDLSELNSDSEFINSNSTPTLPANPGLLQHVAGCGNSSLIQYDGTGGYFIDKLAQGIWRLEVYPDVLWLKDPFEAPSLTRQVARLFFGERTMNLAIPDLGDHCRLWNWSDGKSGHMEVGSFPQAVRPGIYLVTGGAVQQQIVKKYLSHKESFLEGLYIPPPSLPDTYVINKTPRYLVESDPKEFRFQIASERKISRAMVYMRRPGWRGFSSHPLIRVGGFNYAVSDTPNVLHPGRIEYCVVVEAGQHTLVFPDGVESVPGRWDFAPATMWTANVIAPGEPLILFEAIRDRKDLVFPHFSDSRKYSVDGADGPTSEETSLTIRVSFSDESSESFGFQFGVAEELSQLKETVAGCQKVVVQGRSLNDSALTIGINLVMADGTSYGADVQMAPQWKNVEIPLSEFQPRNALLLPDHYPRFLPTIWSGEKSAVGRKPDLQSLTRIQIVTAPLNAQKHGSLRQADFALQRIILDR